MNHRIMKHPELLAPAGSFACAQSAFDHGADAVYAGLGSFNLRAHSPAFSTQGIAELVNYGRRRGKKIYLAINLMPDDELLQNLEKELLALKDLTLPDAFIISDPGVISLCKDIMPQCRIHLSTQSGSFNSRSMLFWKKQGVNRVVLPRELSVSSIRAINPEVVMETEIFIHGAMCVSVSGRCLLGAYTARRHPNLGDCPQPCRFSYTITALEGSENREISFDLEESERGTYLLNSKDLCTVEILPELISTGVSALKIEGRNKSPHYVATVVKVYRKAVDKAIECGERYSVDPAWIRELESIEHRPYTSGFYGEDKIRQELFSSKAKAGHRLVAVIKEMHDGLPVADVKNSFDAGVKINVLPVRNKQLSYDITDFGILDLDGNPLVKARTNRLVKIALSGSTLKPGDMLRVKL